MAADDMAMGVDGMTTGAMAAGGIQTLTRGDSNGTDGTVRLWTSASRYTLVMEAKKAASPSIRSATEGKIVAELMERRRTIKWVSERRGVSFCDAGTGSADTLRAFSNVIQFSRLFCEI